jgi:hypothetical protein
VLGAPARHVFRHRRGQIDDKSCVAAAFGDANPLQQFLRRFAASGPGSRLFAHVLHRVDKPLYRATGGRLTASTLR